MLSPSSKSPVNLEPPRLIPLGGLGEIGMNCLVLEQGGERVIIDCGLSFEGRRFGADVTHVDLAFLAAEPERVRAIVLTHGHEDHVGAVPYLLEVCEAPIYGPPYALSVLRERLAQHSGLDFEPELIPFAPGDRFEAGPFEVEPYRVTHSIPDCVGLILRTNAGVIVHSGDFKVEEIAADGEEFDWARLERLREEEGVRLLLSDSTNALSAGSTGAERAVEAHLEEIVRAAEKRVAVTLFASNVHRLRALTGIARRTGRKVCLIGRSLEMHARIAKEQGYLDDLDVVLIPRELAREMPREKLMVLATGTQGEPPAGFSRLARDDHRALSLEAGDIFIHSARIIPGCETDVFPLFNALERRGIDVLWGHLDRGIHASGHAHRDELQRLIEALQPQAFMPVHGTFVHLKHHREIAETCGVEDTVIVEDGAIVEVGESGLEVFEGVPTGVVHRQRGEPIAARVLADRALLAELGVAMVTAIVDDRGRPVGSPEILTRGVVHEDEAADLLDSACDYVHRALMRMKWRNDRPDLDDVEIAAKRALKRFLGKELRQKPLCYAIVMRA